MEKRKFRMNVLDILIIVLVMLCIAGAVLRVYVKNRDDKLNRDTAVVTFLIQNVQYESKDLIKDGDRVYSEAYDCDFGYVVGEMEAKPALLYAEDDGEIIAVHSNEYERLDLTGTFRCEGTMTESSGFTVNGTQYIAPNMSISVSFPNIKATILILDVELEEKAVTAALAK